MAFINKQDTNGTKGTLLKGELGYDDYTAGGDTGRVYVGNGSTNIALAKKTEVDSKVSRITSADYAVAIFDGTNGQIKNSSSIMGDGGSIEINILGSGDRNAYIDFHSSDGTDYDSRIIKHPGRYGTLEIANTTTIQLVTGGTTMLNLVGPTVRAAATGARGYNGNIMTVVADSLAAPQAVTASNYIQWESSEGAIGISYFESDIRLKDNIGEPTKKALDIFDSISFHSFTWNELTDKEGQYEPIGVIAQEVELIEPKFVMQLSDGKYCMNESNIVSYLMKAVSELSEELKIVKNEIANLKGTSND